MIGDPEHRVGVFNIFDEAKPIFQKLCVCVRLQSRLPLSGKANMLINTSLIVMQHGGDSAKDIQISQRPKDGNLFQRKILSSNV